MDSVCVTYKPRPDATPESGLTALTAVYAFILEAHAKKCAAKQSGQDDAQGENRATAAADGGTRQDALERARKDVA